LLSTKRLYCQLPILGFLLAAMGFAQGPGTAGSVTVTVSDPTAAVITGAKVEITNPKSGYKNSATADANGVVRFQNLPFNNYHLSISASGFVMAQQDVQVRSSVPINLPVILQVGTSGEVVTVEANDLLEAVPTGHTDVDTSLIQKLPEESVSSGLFSVIAEATPGVAQDSNGLSHPQGEHADTSFSIDGQPISDQQTRAFSNPISANAIQSMEVINGVPQAEYGDKTSLVIRTATKSGLGVTTPTGSFSAGYGSFGTSTVDGSLSIGSQKLGNFISVDGTNSGRFLDTPEFYPIHAYGNSENIFDRIDVQLNNSDSFHLNLFTGGAWFQIPNDIDQFAAGQNQRQTNKNFDIAPFFQHLFSATTLITVNAYVRHDQVDYFPSQDPFFDQPATMQEDRRLTNAGLKTDVSYVRGAHNLKAGADFNHTFLTERFNLGITNPAYNAVCLNIDGTPDASPNPTNPALCSAAGLSPNPGFLPGLLPYDLTRGGSLFGFSGHGDIKELAMYVQDAITLGRLTLNLGIRGDLYRGLSSDSLAEPRAGASYQIKKTNTVLRGSYGRFMLTPYNENLLISSETGEGGLAQHVFGAFGSQPLQPARRNHFSTGLEQAIGKYLSVEADYFWKFTDPDFDFDVLFNTSLTFPIQWRKSKIDGASVKVNMPDFHGLTAYSVMGHTRARFFGPEIGGLIFNNPEQINSSAPFRIDHDQAFEQVTHLQYQYGKNVPWFGFTWNYQSGEVAGAVPFATNATAPVNLAYLTADQQLQIGLACGGAVPTLSTPLTSCAPSQLTATRVVIPAPGTENDDRNPPRIAPRHTFDVGAGMDNLFHTDHYKANLRFTVVNLTNKDALYNFLSTFSGTHFIPPRSYTAALGFTF